MGQENVALYAFNRGRISRLALARTDVKRAAFSADLMENWMPRVMGPMSLRVGTGYLGALAGAPRYIPFIFATDDTAIVELTDQIMRVWIDDVILTRPAVTTAITNGSFTTDLSGWTDADETFAVSAWAAGDATIGTGLMSLKGSFTTVPTAAIRRQQVTVAGGNIGVEHALRIVIARGPVRCKVGSSSGADDYVSETDLGTGQHSLAFTPTGDFFVEFSNSTPVIRYVNSCTIESAGAVSIPAPWVAADLGKVRFDQSGDVLFVACVGYQQRRIERRGTGRSWSVLRYKTDNGPFMVENTNQRHTLSMGANFGSTTLASSIPFFRQTHAPSANSDGALFRLATNGSLAISIGGASGITQNNVATQSIKVTGSGDHRDFTISIADGPAMTGTVSLQRSFVGPSGPWEATAVQSWTATGTVTNPFNDGLDEEIVWYRLAVTAYTSGTIFLAMQYDHGVVDTIVRVISFTSSTSVNVEVVSDTTGIAGASDDWSEGEWSDRRGFPSATVLAEGRLWWFGKGGLLGTVSDDFENFDENFEGDAGPINRDIGSGPFDQVSWGLALSRLIAGGQAAEYSIKSSSLDEPLTPTNFNVRADSTQGSASVQATKLDKKGHFVQRGGTRVFELDRGDGVDYDARDLTVLIPEICRPAVSRMAVQRQPDTRIHCVLTDGTVALAVIDRVENVLCWFKVTTRDDDAIVDVVVLPGADGTSEDAVYYAVQRSINGSTVYYHERWALEEDCIGETLNKQADAFVEYTQAASSTITGLSHLIGCDVVVWDNGKCLRDEDDEIATFTVDGSGQISVTNAGVAYLATTGIVGLSYTAQWKSTKLAYAAQGGSALNQRKKFDHLGVILDRTHHRGLKYGPDFDTLSVLPLVEQDADVAEDTIYDHYDEDAFEFEGEWGADSRLCLQAQAPRPCTILAATLPIEERSKK